MNFEFPNIEYGKRLGSKAEMIAFRLMSIFVKGWSKVKVKVKGLTFVVKVNDQQLTFDGRTKF